MRKPVTSRTRRITKPKVPQTKKLIVKEGTVVEIEGPAGVPLAVLPSDTVHKVKVVAPIPEQGFWSWLLFGPDHPKAK